jgi:uncharacterized protein
VPLLLHPLFVWAPPLALSGISHLLIAAIVVALMVYVIMPHYTRLMSRWLYE